MKGWAGYKVYSKNFYLNTVSKQLFELRLEACQVKANNYKEAYQIAKEADDRHYKQLQDQIDKTNRAVAGDTLRNILWAGGGVLVGAGIGIIIGAIVTN